MSPCPAQRRIAGRLQRSRGREERATALEDRLSDQHRVLTELEVEGERARIVVAGVPEGTAVIDGRITNVAGRGLAGLTVDLSDRAGEPIAGIDPVVTDENGFYTLQIGTLDDSQARRRAAHLTVRAVDDRIVHRSARPVTPEVGRRLCRSVRLSRADLRRRPVRRPRRVPPPSTTPAPTSRTPTRGVSAALDALEARDDFAAIGASRAKLDARLAEAGVRTRRDLTRFVRQEAREVRDQLGLRNLPSARAFIGAINELLEGSE